MSVVIPNLGLPVPVTSPVPISYPPTDITVLKSEQIVLATSYIQNAGGESLDDGLEHLCAILNIDPRPVNSIVTVQAQSALGLSATGLATTIDKKFVINSVPTDSVGFWCPSHTATGGAPWSISGMAQSAEIEAGSPIIVRWILSAADPGCEVTTGTTTMTVTVTPGPSVI